MPKLGKTEVSKILEKTKNKQKSESKFKLLLPLLEKVKQKKLYLTSPLVFSIIFILSLFGIIYYLFQLKNCLCFEKRNEEYKANLDYLITIDIVILIFYTILFVSIIFMYQNNTVMSGGNMIVRNIYYIILSIIIVLIVLTIFFLFHIYKLSFSIDESCECSNSKLKYLLYAQSVLSSLFLVGMFVGIYNLLSITN